MPPAPSADPAPGAAARVRIELLGPVRVTIDGAPLAVDTRKAVALLAWLAVNRRPAARETIAGLLWPDADDADAKGALRRTLSVLRSGLHDAGLEVDRSMVGLRPDEVDVDAWRFTDALAAVRAHGHGTADLCATCLDHLALAAGLDRGGFLAGFALRDSETFDEWQVAETEAHARELAGVLERLARGRAATARWDAAADAARRWLALDALHEPAHRLLMEVLARAGEPAAALAQYRECVRVLDRELGVAPLPETTALAEAIRAGTLAPVAVPSAAPAPSTSAAAAAAPVADAIPMVGRDEPLRALGQAIDALVEEGRGGRLVAVTGEPGIGKTRLLDAVEPLIAKRGGRCIRARAWSGESAIAFSVVVELLRAGLAADDAPQRLTGVDPELLREVGRLTPLPGQVRPATGPAEAAADPFGRVRLMQGLVAILGVLVAPGVLVIDDVHLADAASLELLGYLCRRLEDQPVGIVLAWRTEDLPAETAERLLGPARGEGRATVLTLGRLSDADMARLARALAPDLGRDGPGGADRAVAALVADAEGVPLYMVEALAAGREARTVDASLPGGLAALLRARIASVGEVGRQVLAAAAVIGRSFEPALVRVASGRSEDETVAALDELLARGLVRETADPAGRGLRLDFSHGRLRDVAYADLSLLRRRLLHGRVAEGLRADPRLLADAAGRWSLIAVHEAAAGRTAEAAEAHRHAADEARAVYANEVARDHLDAALALGHPDAAALRTQLADVLTLLGDYAGALAHLEAAAAVSTPGAEVGALEHRIGIVHARRGDWSRAETHLGAALDATSDRGSRARILADRSAVAERLGDRVEARRRAVDALALAMDAGDAVGAARARGLLGMLDRRAGDLLAGRRELEAAVAALERAATRHADGGGIAPPDEADRVRVGVLNSLALVLGELGDADAGIARAGQALATCTRIGDRHRQAAIENNLADLCHAAGRAEEALDHLARAVALFAEIGGRPGELEPEIWKLVEW
ncbi:MAG: AAA family ATPase [Chloroflexota bacterium]